MRRPRAARPEVDRSASAGFRFPPEVITVAVRWYLRYGLSYRDVEELLAERGVEVDHVTVYRWAQRFTPLFTDAADAGVRMLSAASAVGEAMKTHLDQTLQEAVDRLQGNHVAERRYCLVSGPAACD